MTTPPRRETPDTTGGRLAPHDAMVRHRVHELERLMQRLAAEKAALENRIEQMEGKSMDSNQSN